MVTYRVSTLARASCTNEVQLFNDLNREPSDVMLKGTIYHSLILENKLPSNIKVLDYDNYKTKQAQLEKQEALSNNLIPMLAKDVEQLTSLDLSEIRLLFTECEVEKKVGFMLDDDTKIVGHTDAVCKADSRVYELKVTNATTFDRVHNAINYSGYDLQLYLHGIANECNNGTVVFFNVDSGLFQQIDIDLGYFTEHCEYKLRNVAIPRLERLEMYKQGITKELPPLHYEIKK